MFDVEGQEAATIVGKHPKGIREMSLEEVKSALRDLTVEERRKAALFILELEKEHVQKTIGPHIADDLDGFSRVVLESIEKLKKLVSKA
jgi:galactokinase